MRDKRMSQEHFDKLMNVSETVISNGLKKKSAGSMPESRYVGFFFSSANELKSILKTQYSLGSAVTELLPNYLRWLDFSDDFHKARMLLSPCDRMQWVELTRDGYQSYLWLLSFAVLLRRPHDDFEKIATYIDAADPGAECKSGRAVYQVGNNRGKDALLDLLLNKVGVSGPQATELFLPSTYKKLLAIIQADPNKRPILMKKYLEGWYAANKKSGWHDMHVRPNNWSYAGYWSFESALVVKLFDIDDSSFRDNAYYPADLVHW